MSRIDKLTSTILAKEKFLRPFSRTLLLNHSKLLRVKMQLCYHFFLSCLWAEVDGESCSGLNRSHVSKQLLQPTQGLSHEFYLSSIIQVNEHALWLWAIETVPDYQFLNIYSVKFLFSSSHDKKVDFMWFNPKWF